MNQREVLLEQVVTESAWPLLGLALPPGFQLAVAASDRETVDGYFVHWMDPDRVAQQVSFFEARLSEAAGRTVRIATTGHAVYPTVQAGGQIALYAMHVAFQLLIVGVGVVPYLLVEEKETHTFDALLVSPASFGQVVAGKAVAGALLAVLTPVIVGFGIGYLALGAFLAASILTGQLMANFLSNSGGAWDNAKKFIEEGNLGGKGSEAHKAAVIGDTVGDPFKDTAGPALNPLIKVMNLISLLVLPAVIVLGDSPWRYVVAGVSAVILISAVAWSRRPVAGLAPAPAGDPSAVEA